MPEWEYLYIVCFWHKDDWFPRRVNGREVPDWREGPALAEFSNQLGQDGQRLSSRLQRRCGVLRGF